MSLQPGVGDQKSLALLADQESQGLVKDLSRIARAMLRLDEGCYETGCLHAARFLHCGPANKVSDQISHEGGHPTSTPCKIAMTTTSSSELRQPISTPGAETGTASEGQNNLINPLLVTMSTHRRRLEGAASPQLLTGRYTASNSTRMLLLVLVGL
jgi:hypothetical protein